MKLGTMRVRFHARQDDIVQARTVCTLDNTFQGEQMTRN